MTPFIILPLLSHLSTTQCSSGSWRGSICEQRIRIHDQLLESPSLKNSLEESVIKAYPAALKIALQETSLPISVFPPSCLYTLEQLLNEDFYPVV